MKFEIGIRPEIGVYVIGYDVYSIRLMSSVLNSYSSHCCELADGGALL